MGRGAHSGTRAPSTSASPWRAEPSRRLFWFGDTRPQLRSPTYGGRAAHLNPSLGAGHDAIQHGPAA